MNFKTEKKGIITNTEFFPVAGGYKQKVIYQYKFKNEIYENTFIADKFTGKKVIGDSIKIKFKESNRQTKDALRKANPNISNKKVRRLQKRILKIELDETPFFVKGVLL